MGTFLGNGAKRRENFEILEENFGSWQLILRNKQGVVFALQMSNNRKPTTATTVACSMPSNRQSGSSLFRVIRYPEKD